MEMFINDELVEAQENPLGTIPFIHISNKKVPSSPWGLSDIQDITDLNRQYNETATLISDIINYYAAPVTIVTGAKTNEFIRGAQKVWAIPNDKANVKNLEMVTELDGPLKFLELLKEKMHEIVGIPINALGQEMSISNTSGVALSLTFLSIMQKFRQLATQYSSGLSRLNELIIRAVALYMPEMLQIDPDRDPPLEEGQLQVLDPRDPLTYRNTVEFASPLPLDKLIALNEIQMEMALGLESKIGALRTLGNPYPAQKFEELLNELHQDSLEQGALDLQNAKIRLVTQMLTGIDPAADGAPAGGQQGGVQSAGGPGVNTAGGAGVPAPSGPQMAPAEFAALYQELNTLSQGTKIPQVRNPGKEDD